MVEEEIGAVQYELPVSIGARLRAAREAKGMSLGELAAETRITQRHLAQIEADDFASLPGRTYALGFSRSFAKAVDLDDDEIAEEVRAELALMAPRDTRALTFEPGDPARVPSARLAWFSAFAALVLLAGGAIFIWTSFVSPGGSLPWLTAGREPAPAATQPAAPAAAAAAANADEVVFTALEDGVWVSFYDKDGRKLLEKQMALGERFAVPALVEGPQLRTGRPDALGITVGGKPVPKLAESQQVVKDVPVSAAALLARPAPADAAQSAVVSPAEPAASQAAPVPSSPPSSSPTA